MEEIFSTIKDRVLQIANYKRVKKESFFESLGLSYGNFKGKSKKSALSADVLADISSKYPEINIEWLLTGNGEMIKEEIENKINDVWKEKYYTLLEKYNTCLEDKSKLEHQNKSKTVISNKSV